MYKGITFAILVLLITPSLSADYDYYVFAAEWTGTVCHLKNCTDLASQAQTNWFNIHGLWPSNFDGTSPAFCDNATKFSSESLSPSTKQAADKLWNGLYASTDDFHAHEWEKHGTCWNNNLNQGNKIDDFFVTVMNIAKGLNIYEVLEQGGIVPGKNSTPAEIHSVINATYGSTLIECNSGYLLQFHICLDLEYQVINCPKDTLSCGKLAIYPEFNFTSQVEENFEY